MAMKQGELVPASVVEEITRVEYHGEPVLTTAQLAEFYECSPKQIKQNYNNNVDRFIRGKHFFRLDGDDLRTFKHEVENFDLAAPQLNLLYLWTKRGAARHAKMLNTDRAWEVFEALEDNYFDRPAVKQPDLLAATLADFVALGRERLNFEREQFNLANNEESKKIAKVQLLRELASASKDDFLRYDLVHYAAKLLIGDDFDIPKYSRRRIAE